MILQVPFRHVLVDKGKMIFVLTITNQGYQVLVMYPCQMLSLQRSSENCCSGRKKNILRMITNCNSIYKNIKYFNLLFIRIMKRMVTEGGGGRPTQGNFTEILSLSYLIGGSLSGNVAHLVL